MLAEAKQVPSIRANPVNDFIADDVRHEREGIARSGPHASEGGAVSGLDEQRPDGFPCCCTRGFRQRGRSSRLLSRVVHIAAVAIVQCPASQHSIVPELATADVVSPSHGHASRECAAAHSQRCRAKHFEARLPDRQRTGRSISFGAD